MTISAADAEGTREKRIFNKRPMHCFCVGRFFMDRRAFADCYEMTNAANVALSHAIGQV